MQTALDEYKASLDVTMQKLTELQTQLHTSTNAMQASIDNSTEHLQACKQGIPAMETWMSRLWKRNEKKE